MHALYRAKDGRVFDLFATDTGFAFAGGAMRRAGRCGPHAYIDGGNVAVTYRAVDGTIHRAELAGRYLVVRGHCAVAELDLSAQIL